MHLRLLLALLATFASLPAYSNVIGVYGRVYVIQEEDSVQYFKRRLTEMEKDGTIHQKQEEAKARVRESILHPKPVPGITTAQTHRVFYWDPTHVLDRPVTDGKGHVVYPVGFKINPLEYSGLSKRLVFIDGRDKSQVELVKKEKKTHPRDKIILTGGSYIELTKTLHEQVFYDQSGYLTRKFGIKHVPAVVTQEGLRLKIEEVPQF